MKTLHTIQYTQDGLTVKATQEYRESYHGGNYNWVVTNTAGHILKTGHTSSNVPNNKLSTDELARILTRELRWLDDEDRELYGLSKGAK
jgi:hypothetical protein